MSDDDKIIRFPRFERIDLNATTHTSFGFGHYILKDREPVQVDLMTWAMEFERRYKIAAQTGKDPWRVNMTDFGRAWISTVFLGLDHNFYREGPPILYETMIFGGRLDEFQNRCSTWAEAEAMHAEAVALARGGHLKIVK